MKYEEMGKNINDKKIMEKSIENVCAYCFENMQIDCEGCPVAEMEVEVMLGEEK